MVHNTSLSMSSTRLGSQAELSPRALISHLATRAINETRLTLELFAMTFAEHYFATVPESQRRIQVAAGNDAYQDARANSKQVSRWLNGSVHIPVEAMVPLIMSLPEPYQHQCRVELTKHLGSMFVPIEKATESQTAMHFGELIMAAGSCISACSPVFDDGVLNEHDLPFISDALQKINELQSHLTAMNAGLLEFLKKYQK